MRPRSRVTVTPKSGITNHLPRLIAREPSATALLGWMLNRLQSPSSVRRRQLRPSGRRMGTGTDACASGAEGGRDRRTDVGQPAAPGPVGSAGALARRPDPGQGRVQMNTSHV